MQNGATSNFIRVVVIGGIVFTAAGVAQSPTTKTSAGKPDVKRAAAGRGYQVLEASEVSVDERSTFVLQALAGRDSPHNSLQLIPLIPVHKPAAHEHRLMK